MTVYSVQAQVIYEFYLATLHNGSRSQSHQSSKICLISVDLYHSMFRRVTFF